MVYKVVRRASKKQEVSTKRKMSQEQAQQTLKCWMESNREELSRKGMSEALKEFRSEYRATIGYKRRTQGTKITGKGAEKAESFSLYFSEYMEGGELKGEVPKSVRSKYMNWINFMYKEKTRGGKKVSPCYETDKECYDRLIELGYFKELNTVEKCKARAEEEKKKPKRKAGRKPLSDEEKADRAKKKAEEKERKANERALKKQKSDEEKALKKQKAKEAREAKKAKKALEKGEKKNAKKPKKTKKSKAKSTKKKKKVSKKPETADVNGTLDQEEYELEKQKDELDQKFIEQAQDDEDKFDCDDSESEAEDLDDAALEQLQQRLKKNDESVSSEDDEEVQEESDDESDDEESDDE